MQLDALLWMFLPLFIAAGSALLCFYIMQARMDVALAKEREQIAHTRAQLEAQKGTADERVKATEEATRRKSLDDFMQDFRVEERHYIRENKTAFNRQKSMVLQERLFFRNIPLSNWVEHEMVVEENTDVAHLAKNYSVFGTSQLSDQKRPTTAHVVRQNDPPVQQLMNVVE